MTIRHRHPVRLRGSAAAVLALLAALALSACAETPTEPMAEAKQLSAMKAETKDKLLKDGQSALDAGDFDSARDNYTQILTIDSQNAQARFGLGEVFLGLHQPDDALDAFKSVAAEKGLEAQARQGMGICYLMLQKPNDAAKNLIDAVKMDPSLWRAWNALGELYDSRRDWPQARQSYEAALKSNPRSEVVQNNLGVSLLMQGKYQEAAPHFIDALKTKPNFEKAKMNLRLVLAWQGKYAEARAGVPLEERPIVLNNIGYIAILRGDYDTAESYLNQAINASPSYFAPAQQNLNYLESIRAGNADLGTPGKLAK
jgi:Tfp pilus assembly protein PilF